MHNLRNLPKIDDFLADARVLASAGGVPRQRLTAIIRACVDQVRASMLRDDAQLQPVSRAALFEQIVRDILSALRAHTAECLTPVINATGVIVHTNLGRAPLSKASAAHALALATEYHTLEFSLKTGARRNRLAYVERLLCDLTGAEAALVVNNNAAAVLLAVAALCAGKEVLLSRGEIVEIGDSFRIADIIALGGCTITEVGTTNRTYLSDYARAVSESTAAIIKIHPSNYTITGFTAEASARELQQLAGEHGLLFLEDMGSGVMADLRAYGLAYERTVADAIAEGVGVVTISGDKMLGGPQAGILLGREAYIAPMKAHQLLRCLRIDKLSLAALEATLAEYTKKAPDIPVLCSIGQRPDALKARANRLCDQLSAAARGFTFMLEPHTARVGGGTLPAQSLQSWGVLSKSPRISANDLETRLRNAPETPIVATLHPDGVLLDVIAIPDERFCDVVKVFSGLTP